MTKPKFTEYQRMAFKSESHFTSTPKASPQRDEIERKAREHFKGLPCPEPNEVAVFAIQHGWNAALKECSKRVALHECHVDGICRCGMEIEAAVNSLRIPEAK